MAESGAETEHPMATEIKDTNWAKQLLRTASLRATAARVAVLKHLAAAGTPLSHAEVVEALQEAGFDQSTLFRCLTELSQANLVARLDLGDQVRRFELRDTTSEVELNHPHFMCVDCGELSCLSDFTIQITPSRGPRREKLGVITEVLLRGHCGRCTTGNSK
jgi:Fur family ferric uptake transcriptional regulator